MAVLRRCADCPELAEGTRCPEHEAEAGNPRGTTTQRGLGSDWDRVSRAAVAAWVAAHGMTCPGDGMGQGEHPAADLTGDHDLPRAAGGTAHDGVTVRCRSCNSRRGARGAPSENLSATPSPRNDPGAYFAGASGSNQTARPAHPSRRWFA